MIKNNHIKIIPTNSLGLFSNVPIYWLSSEGPKEVGAGYGEEDSLCLHYRLDELKAILEVLLAKDDLIYKLSYPTILDEFPELELLKATASLVSDNEVIDEFLNGRNIANNHLFRAKIQANKLIIKDTLFNVLDNLAYTYLLEEKRCSYPQKIILKETIGNLEPIELYFEDNYPPYYLYSDIIKELKQSINLARNSFYHPLECLNDDRFVVFNKIVTILKNNNYPIEDLKGFPLFRRIRIILAYLSLGNTEIDTFEKQLLMYFEDYIESGKLLENHYGKPQPEVKIYQKVA